MRTQDQTWKGSCEWHQEKKKTYNGTGVGSGVQGDLQQWEP